MPCAPRFASLQPHPLPALCRHAGRRTHCRGLYPRGHGFQGLRARQHLRTLPATMFSAWHAPAPHAAHRNILHPPPSLGRPSVRRPQRHAGMPARHPPSSPQHACKVMDNRMQGRSREMREGENVNCIFTLHASLGRHWLQTRGCLLPTLFLQPTVQRTPSGRCPRSGRQHGPAGTAAGFNGGRSAGTCCRQVRVKPSTARCHRTACTAHTVTAWNPRLQTRGCLLPTLCPRSGTPACRLAVRQRGPAGTAAGVNGGGSARTW